MTHEETMTNKGGRRRGRRMAIAVSLAATGLLGLGSVAWACTSSLTGTIAGQPSTANGGDTFTATTGTALSGGAQTDWYVGFKDSQDSTSCHHTAAISSTTSSTSGGVISGANARTATIPVAANSGTAQVCWATVSHLNASNPSSITIN